MNQLQFLRFLVILNGAVPLLMLTWDAYRGQLGVNSVNYALHVTGLLSLVFLFLSLGMTPLRWTTGWGGWIAFRRSLGLYAFFYSLLHVVIYIGFDRALSMTSTLQEIGMRRFLQVGTAAICLMVPLAVTSTNSMIRRIGPVRWKQLHRLAYVVAMLGVVHYYMLVKSDVRQPLAFAGVLSVLLCGRFGHHYWELRQATRTLPRIQLNHVETNVSTTPSPIVAVETPTLRRQWKGELKVAAIFQETHDVKTFRLVPVDEGSFPFEYVPGQFLNLQLMIAGERVNRSYTIASSPTRTHACELSIKREPMGLASRFLHDQIKPGDTLKVSGPAGRFVFTGQGAPGVLLIAGGVGITPLMSILRYLTDRAWSGEIYFLIVAKTENDLIFEDELRWLQRRLPRFKVSVTLTRCAGDSMWNGERGRATASLLGRFVPNLTHLPIFLCGPNEMMDATRELLSGMGVSPDQIKTEAFVSRTKGSPFSNVTSDDSTVDGALEEPSVNSFSPEVVSAKHADLTVSITFARSNILHNVTSELSVLEAAEAASIDLPYECRSGICGQCKTRLIEGTVVMDCEDALSPSEKSRGFILACQARPRSNLVVDV